MTPKEKAEELYKKFSMVGLQQRDEGIECALICVDEIYKSLTDESKNDYWIEVKKELEKL